MQFLNFIAVIIAIFSVSGIEVAEGEDVVILCLVGAMCLLLVIFNNISNEKENKK